jgi:pilus assembly protein Flp/PilA
MKEVTTFLKDEQGVTSVEYAVLSALIVLAILGSVVLVGGNVGDLFDAVSSQLTAAMGGP